MPKHVHAASRATTDDSRADTLWQVGSDWIAWHSEYDDPGSSLARRLHVVQRELRRVLTSADLDETPFKLISICAGDGRDVLPVIAAAQRDVRALLVELDPHLAGWARRAVTEFQLPHVEIRIADAGMTDAYVGFGPAHVVMAGGVFGNISVADARVTVEVLPRLLHHRGVVIWTRGRGDGTDDPSSGIRELFAQAGFTELSFTAPDDVRFRVGVHRLDAPKTAAGPVRAGTRLFTFA